MEIGPRVPTRKILRAFNVYENGGHLGYVTIIILMFFISLYLKAYIQNLVRKWFLIKANFYFDMVKK